MKKGFAWLMLALTLPFMAATAYGLDEFDEGSQYARIDTPERVEPAGDGKVEVVELFWYGCPHCFHLEPEVTEWLKHKPDNVEFVRVPAIFANPLWRTHAQAFYAAEAIGVLDKVHEPMFEAIHKLHRPLDTEEKIADFVAEQGVDRQKFVDAWKSFSVFTKVNRAAYLSKRYGITGVPALVVDGALRTDGGMAGGQKEMFQVVDYLVQQQTKLSKR